MGDEKKSQGIFEGYGRDGRLLASHATLMGVFNLIFAAFLLFAKKTDRPIPERVEPSDILLLGVATHKLSWLVARESVTSPLRAPFTEFQEEDSTTHVDEKPRGEGLQYALGELLTCHFCLGQWIAAFFTYGLVLAPRVTRLVAAVFATVTLSDHLHQTYKALMDRA